MANPASSPSTHYAHLSPDHLESALRVSHLSKAAMRWYSLKVRADMPAMIALDSLGGSMASITIRNLDDDLKAKLRVLAASHGRSMEEEARIIIRQALSRQEKRGGLGTRIHSRFASVGGVDLA